jgi:hypothetical protein
MTQGKLPPRRQRNVTKPQHAELPPYEFDVEDAIASHRHFLASLTDRDLAFMFLSGPDIDWDAHLLAIRGFLRFRKIDDEKFERDFEEIKAAAKAGRGSSMQIDMEYVDHLHGKVFQDAVHSMAAVGMLAPFVESLFEQAFYGIRDKFERERWMLVTKRRRRLKPAARWDCHYISNTKKNLVLGIADMAANTELAQFLPPDFKVTLEALFGYRNKNFHMGLEWPEHERRAFVRRMEAEKWPPEWFEHSSHGPDPWIFYMTDAFIDHCLKFVEAVLHGLGAFYRNLEAGLTSPRDKDAP